MHTEEQELAFSQSVGVLATRPREEVESFLSQLFMVFDDNTARLETMWGLLHLIEDYDLGSVIQNYCRVITDFEIRAPEWVKTFMYRFLNSAESRILLGRSMSTLSEAEQTVLKELLNTVATEDEEQYQKVQAVLRSYSWP